MRWLIVGDVHGNRRFANQAFELAAAGNVDGVIQLGDLGFWPGGHHFVAHIRRRAAASGLPVLIVPGNHDYPGEGSRYDGGYLGYVSPVPVAGEIVVLERGAVIELDGVRLGAMGGGISIDRGERVENKSWWPTEALADDDIAVAVGGGPVDVWLTHDTPTLPPGISIDGFGDELRQDLQAQQNRLIRVFNELRPKLHIHGHYHIRYDAPTAFGRVLGLGCEDATSACHVLDLGSL